MMTNNVQCHAVVSASAGKRNIMAPDCLLVFDVVCFANCGVFVKETAWIGLEFT